MLKKIFNSLSAGKESVDELYDEIEVLREECDSLNEVIKKKDVKIDKLYAEIEKLEKQLSEKGASDRIDQNLLDKLDQELKNRDLKIKELENENASIAKKIALDVDEEKLDTVLEPNLFNYRVLINDYYEARKFESFKKSCEDLGLVYINQLETLDFDTLPLTDTKIKNARIFFEDFKAGFYDLDMKKYLVKGEKISKVFFRFRSFVKYCKVKKLNYMIELDNIDLKNLEEEGFTPVQIDKIKNKLNEYNDLKRIKK